MYESTIVDFSCESNANIGCSAFFGTVKQVLTSALCEVTKGADTSPLAGVAFQCICSLSNTQQDARILAVSFATGCKQQARNSVFWRSHKAACCFGPLTSPSRVTVMCVMRAIFKPICLIKHASVSQIWLGLRSPAESDDVKASPHQLMAQLLLPQSTQFAKIKYWAHDFAAAVMSVSCRKVKT